MPKVTIDGVEIEVAPGTTILQAALTQGREIPHYCYHPGLSIAGNCRMCLVEVEKQPKLVIACYTPVADGMVVYTNNAKVQQAREAMMEFFLINHPLDCPICDQAGECRLQEYAVEYGSGKSRYTEPRLALSKAVDIGPHVMLDQERCIQCSRCIRFCQEVTGTSELTFFQRGERAQIAIHPGRRLDNPYSGNVVDICPVGALTLKEFRFQSRVWYLTNTASVCAGCSRGCNVVVGTSAHDHYQLGEIRRLVPRVNMDVNQWWMCDEGRLSFRTIQQAERAAKAEAPAGAAVEYEDAVAKAGALLRQAAAAGRAAAVVSPRSTSETLFAWRETFAGAGDVTVGVQRLRRGADDALLIRADKGANSTGAAWVFGEHATVDRVLDAVKQGKVDVLVVVGDPLDPADSFDLPADLAGAVRDVVYVGALVGGAARRASVVLPAAAWGEEDGSMANDQGRVQWLRRAHLPRCEARPGWRVAADVAEAGGHVLGPWGSTSEVLASLAGSVPEYSGLDVDAIGMLGVLGKVRAAAGA